MGEGEGDDEVDEEVLLQRKREKYTKEYRLHDIRLPTKVRLIGNVEPPLPSPLPDRHFWLDEDQRLPNVELIKEHLRREGKISKEHFGVLLDTVYDLFCEEDNLLYIDAPITICGDVHGQYYDLLKLFEVGGDPKNTTYLFLGDYVDRGLFSVECLILLYSYKVLYPASFFLLRGNHECRHVTEYFTFRDECLHKYDMEIYTSIMDTFDALPLAAVVNKQFFCVHGGLSPELLDVSDLDEVDRFIEIPTAGILTDLLWADPLDGEDYSDPSLAPLPYPQQFLPNPVRGCSYHYTYYAAQQFLSHNHLLSLIRAHEAQANGYQMHKTITKTGFPSVITLFSAPNYLDHHGNRAAVLRYENNIFNVRQFSASPHPYVLPNFANVFNWSLPFLSEKVAELLLSVFNLVDDAAAEVEEEMMRRRELLKSKLMVVSKMLVLYKRMRDERQALLAAGSLSANGTQLPMTLEGGEEVEVAPVVMRADQVKKTLRDSLSSDDPFGEVKKLDQPNEARPPLDGSSMPSVGSAPSLGQLKRLMARARILSDKRNSLPLRKTHAFIIKDAPTEVPTISPETLSNSL
uniref:Serine/threonine-protein phosphatase n=1 Tax=Arcella intermedia TaxID=1963864 RepID=A0A6B2L051_9EUKA